MRAEEKKERQELEQGCGLGQMDIGRRRVAPAPYVTARANSDKLWGGTNSDTLTIKRMQRESAYDFDYRARPALLSSD